MTYTEKCIKHLSDLHSGGNLAAASEGVLLSPKSSLSAGGYSAADSTNFLIFCCVLTLDICIPKQQN